MPFSIRQILAGFLCVILVGDSARAAAPGFSPAPDRARETLFAAEAITAPGLAVRLAIVPLASFRKAVAVIRPISAWYRAVVRTPSAEETALAELREAFGPAGHIPGLLTLELWEDALIADLAHLSIGPYGIPLTPEGWELWREFVIFEQLVRDIRLLPYLSKPRQDAAIARHLLARVDGGVLSAVTAWRWWNTAVPTSPSPAGLDLPLSGADDLSALEAAREKLMRRTAIDERKLPALAPDSELLEELAGAAVRADRGLRAALRELTQYADARRRFLAAVQKGDIAEAEWQADRMRLTRNAVLEGISSWPGLPTFIEDFRTESENASYLLEAARRGMPTDPFQVLSVNAISAALADSPYQATPGVVLRLAGLKVQKLDFTWWSTWREPLQYLRRGRLLTENSDISPAKRDLAQVNYLLGRARAGILPASVAREWWQNPPTIDHAAAAAILGLHPRNVPIADEVNRESAPPSSIGWRTWAAMAAALALLLTVGIWIRQALKPETAANSRTASVAGATAQPVISDESRFRGSSAARAAILQQLTQLRQQATDLQRTRASREADLDHYRQALELARQKLRAAESGVVSAPANPSASFPAAMDFQTATRGLSRARRTPTPRRQTSGQTDTSTTRQAGSAASSATQSFTPDISTSLDRRVVWQYEKQVSGFIRMETWDDYDEKTGALVGVRPTADNTDSMQDHGGPSTNAVAGVIQGDFAALPVPLGMEPNPNDVQIQSGDPEMTYDIHDDLDGHFFFVEISKHPITGQVRVRIGLRPSQDDSWRQRPPRAEAFKLMMHGTWKTDSQTAIDEAKAMQGFEARTGHVWEHTQAKGAYVLDDKINAERGSRVEDLDRKTIDINDEPKRPLDCATSESWNAAKDRELGYATRAETGFQANGTTLLRGLQAHAIEGIFNPEIDPKTGNAVGWTLQDATPKDRTGDATRLFNGLLPVSQSTLAAVRQSRQELQGALQAEAAATGAAQKARVDEEAVQRKQAELERRLAALEAQSEKAAAQKDEPIRSDHEALGRRMAAVIQDIEKAAQENPSALVSDLLRPDGRLSRLRTELRNEKAITQARCLTTVLDAAMTHLPDAQARRLAARELQVWAQWVTDPEAATPQVLAESSSRYGHPDPALTVWDVSHPMPIVVENPDLDRTDQVPMLTPPTWSMGAPSPIRADNGSVIGFRVGDTLFGRRLLPIVGGAIRADRIDNVIATPNGRLLAVSNRQVNGSQDEQVVVTDVLTGQDVPLANGTRHIAGNSIQFMRDGQGYYLAISESGVARLLTFPENQNIHSLILDSSPALFVSDDEALVLYNNTNKSLTSFAYRPSRQETSSTALLGGLQGLEASGIRVVQNPKTKENYFVYTGTAVERRGVYDENGFPVTPLGAIRIGPVLFDENQAHVTMLIQPFPGASSVWRHFTFGGVAISLDLECELVGIDSGIQFWRRDGDGSTLLVQGQGETASFPLPHLAQGQAMTDGRQLYFQVPRIRNPRSYDLFVLHKKSGEWKIERLSSPTAQNATLPVRFNGFTGILVFLEEIDGQWVLRGVQRESVPQLTGVFDARPDGSMVFTVRYGYKEGLYEWQPRGDMGRLTQWRPEHSLLSVVKASDGVFYLANDGVNGAGLTRLWRYGDLDAQSPSGVRVERMNVDPAGRLYFIGQVEGTSTHGVWQVGKQDPLFTDEAQSLGDLTFGTDGKIYVFRVRNEEDQKWIRVPDGIVVTPAQSDFAHMGWTRDGQGFVGFESSRNHWGVSTVGGDAREWPDAAGAPFLETRSDGRVYTELPLKDGSHGVLAVPSGDVLMRFPKGSYVFGEEMTPDGLLYARARINGRTGLYAAAPSGPQLVVEGKGNDGKVAFSPESNMAAFIADDSNRLSLVTGRGRTTVTVDDHAANSDLPTDVPSLRLDPAPNHRPFATIATNGRSVLVSDPDKEVDWFLDMALQFQEHHPEELGTDAWRKTRDGLVAWADQITGPDMSVPRRVKLFFLTAGTPAQARFARLLAELDQQEGRLQIRAAVVSIVREAFQAMRTRYGEIPFNPGVEKGGWLDALLTHDLETAAKLTPPWRLDHSPYAELAVLNQRLRELSAAVPGLKLSRDDFKDLWPSPGTLILRDARELLHQTLFWILLVELSSIGAGVYVRGKRQQTQGHFDALIKRMNRDLFEKDLTVFHFPDKRWRLDLESLAPSVPSPLRHLAETLFILPIPWMLWRVPQAIALESHWAKLLSGVDLPAYLENQVSVVHLHKAQQELKTLLRQRENAAA